MRKLSATEHTPARDLYVSIVFKLNAKPFLSTHPHQKCSRCIAIDQLNFMSFHFESPKDPAGGKITKHMTDNSLAFSLTQRYVLNPDFMSRYAPTRTLISTVLIAVHRTRIC